LGISALVRIAAPAGLGPQHRTSSSQAEGLSRAASRMICSSRPESGTGTIAFSSCAVIGRYSRASTPH